MLIFDKEHYPPSSSHHVKLSDSTFRLLGKTTTENYKDILSELGQNIGKILFANTEELGLTVVIA